MTAQLLLDSFFFFFQAEDGIRDVAVTGVQTCALPISSSTSVAAARSISRHSSSGIPAWSRRLRARARGSFGNQSFNSSLDRKSTRLNSSHGYISYAVFCLKKKKKKRRQN